MLSRSTVHYSSYWLSQSRKSLFSCFSIFVAATMREVDPLLCGKVLSLSLSLFFSTAFITLASCLIEVVKPVNSCTAVLGKQCHTETSKGLGL